MPELTVKFVGVLIAISSALWLLTTTVAQQPHPSLGTGAPPRKAAELIKKQPPINVSAQLFESATANSQQVRVSLSKQRAYLLLGDEVVIDTPISSGKRAGMTPTGHFTVLEKDKSHHSNRYGDFRDSSGRIVRAGVSAHIDSAPSGTHFVGAEMKWFLRLTGDGVGMHIGILPGYPASHGCIRESAEGAKLFYDHVKVGTPVDVGDY